MFGGDSYFDSIESYLRYYGLDFEGKKIGHQFLRFKSNGYELAGQVFEPADYKATVFLLHGFLDHCGLLKKIIEFLASSGYAVACLDLPGHGLSGGQRAGIEDFSQYSDALRDFANEARPKLHGPYHIIGHSTGGAAVIDYLLTREDNIFDKVILAGPLVRSVLYRASKIAFGLDRPFMQDVPRVYRHNTADKEFLKFVRQEPLRIKIVPLTWIKAFYKWSDNISSARSCERTVKIIQGTHDTTVAWRFNIKFLKSKFSDVEVSLIKHCGHEMFNEAVDMRKEIFSQINHYLETK